MVERLLARPRFKACSVLLTRAAWDALSGALPLSTDTPPVFVVSQRVMNEIAGFNIHRGCLALAERPARETLTAAHLAGARRVVVLEGVNNPDNIGGIFRSAAAFGVDLVVLGPACSDPFYRKAIRTSMAATLQVPFVEAGRWPERARSAARGWFRAHRVDTVRRCRAARRRRSPHRARRVTDRR